MKKSVVKIMDCHTNMDISNQRESYFLQQISRLKTSNKCSNYSRIITYFSQFSNEKHLFLENGGMCLQDIVVK